MSKILSLEIIHRVNVLINDKGFIRWSKAELLDYLNDAQKAIVLRRPDAYCVDVDDFACVSGTKQRIPDDAIRLIDIPRNATGHSIKGPYARRYLDDLYPDWHSVNDASHVEAYVYDERNPKTFYVYPGVNAGIEISLVISKTPPVISIAELETNQALVIDEIYRNALMEWIMYRVFMKDAEHSSLERSMMHLNAFKSQLGEKSQADGAMASQGSV